MAAEAVTAVVEAAAPTAVLAAVAITVLLLPADIAAAQHRAALAHRLVAAWVLQQDGHPLLDGQLLADLLQDGLRPSRPPRTGLTIFIPRSPMDSGILLAVRLAVRPRMELRRWRTTPPSLVPALTAPASLAVPDGVDTVVGAVTVGAAATAAGVGAEAGVGDLASASVGDGAGVGVLAGDGPAGVGVQDGLGARGGTARTAMDTPATITTITDTIGRMNRRIASPTILRRRKTTRQPTILLIRATRAL
jgi:hypothetical protein